MSDNVTAELRDAYEKRRPVDEVVHRQMMSVVSLYLIVGGMPAAVNAYVQTQNMQKVIAQQRAIINLYKRDISRYDPKEKLYLDDIFELIPSELNAKNKRFILKGNVNVNFGAVYEDFVAQELVSKGYPTFYFNSKKLGELDFVIDNGNGEVIPIEVKSGKDYYVHAALDNVMDVQY